MLCLRVQRGTHNALDRLVERSCSVCPCDSYSALFSTHWLPCNTFKQLIIRCVVIILFPFLPPGTTHSQPYLYRHCHPSKNILQTLFLHTINIHLMTSLPLSLFSPDNVLTSSPPLLAPHNVPTSSSSLL